MNGKYFIKDGYIDNKLDSNSGCKDYIWNIGRVNRNLYENYHVYKYALKIAKKYRFKTILDIGCGVGVKLNHFFIKNDFNVTAIDNLQAINYCKQKYKNATFKVIDLSLKANIKSISNDKFDLIISVDVVEHFENPVLFLEFIKANVKSNSLVIISTPERDFVRGKHNIKSPNKNHVREWNKKEFELFIRHNGYVILEHFLTKPIKFNSSIFYLKNHIYYLLNFRKFKGTQVVLMKIQD